ncbi:GDSL-type esterase/lipase family protein [Clostridium cibarium]|uniref:SGNH hydrolase-type esterase domain-containing protein n=1 Tax=Clostridium cibarium TaxID=2762247 RepID=A0ABR8PRH8_9CLOT|nr:GDSL-type esterase/lipase family protein [Clostridium cibarium]MBD7910757.1 hypothetical protein [Clostridium cibarium]
MSRRIEKEPKPVLIGEINTEKAGKNAKALIGDVDGDGRMELVMVQANGGIDDRYEPHQVQAITTFDLEGNLLWQVGIPSDIPGEFGSDFPAQIADIDGDGINEVLCVMNKKFKILDGKTGKVKKEYDLPNEEAHDCIIVANLSGNEFPQDIILKNRYTKMWAMDKNFNLLWEHEGNIGHYPWICDINGDDKDEVLAGYDMLDSKGNVLWSCKDLKDHADCITIGDVLRNPARGGQIVIGGSGNSTVMYSWDGKEMWRYENSVEAQHIAVGQFREDLEGLQIAGLDRIVRGELDGTVNPETGRDGIFILDCNGKELIKENRETKGWLTIIETFHNWSGNKKDYILAYRRGGGVLPTLYNGFLEPVATFPVDGYVIHADLLNNNIECVIIYSDGKASIFAAKFMDISRYENIPIEQSKRLSHSTLYPGADVKIVADKYYKGTLPIESKIKELRYKFPLENDIYDVSITFGGSETTSYTESVKVGNRRLYLKSIITAKGELVKKTFSVNVFDNELRIAIDGENPVVNDIEIYKADAKTIFLAGDSIVCDHFEEPYTGWGQVLPSFFDEGVAVSNHAFGGRTAVSFIKESRLDDILQLIKPNDYLFIQFGHNDQKPGMFYSDANGKYKRVLREYINVARKKGAIPVLITSMPRREFGEDEKIVNTHGYYPEAVRELAKEEGVVLIDLNYKGERLVNSMGVEESKKLFLHYAPGEFPGYPDGIKDNSHFCEDGAIKIAELIVEGIKENKLELVKYFRKK